MLITWNGHACFTITLADGRKIVTDPFDDSVGYSKPDVFADVVTVSHGHHDHNCLDALNGYKTVLDKEGSYTSEGVRISAVSSFHDDAKGEKRGMNLLFKIEAEGKSIVHLGDLGHMLTEEQYSFIRGCDILLIPIGGTYTITCEQAINIIGEAKPVCAVPMHYLTPALTFPIMDEKSFQQNTNAVSLGKKTEDAENLRGCVIFEY